MKALSQREYSIIEHSLGMSDKKTIPSEYYRNIFCAGEGQEDYQLLCDMRDRGTLKKGRDVGSGFMWYVTPVGKQLFEYQFKESLAINN